jgi:hypothetical protein
MLGNKIILKRNLRIIYGQNSNREIISTFVRDWLLGRHYFINPFLMSSPYMNRIKMFHYFRNRGWFTPEKYLDWEK